MKLASELRTGNVIMINDAPMVVVKAELSKSGRNAAVVKPIGNRRVSASKRRRGAGSLGDTLMEDKADLYGRRKRTRYPAWAGER